MAIICDTIEHLFYGVVMSELSIVNLSGYRFVTLTTEQLPTLRVELKSKADACQLKGTILLSTEGINAFLAGSRENIDSFVSFLHAYPELVELRFKESFTDYQPFNRML